MGGEARRPFLNFILGVLRKDRDTGLMFMNSFGFLNTFVLNMEKQKLKIHNNCYKNYKNFP